MLSFRCEHLLVRLSLVERGFAVAECLTCCRFVGEHRCESGVNRE